MARTEYVDDPEAPAPNSLVPAASAVVVDDEGRILLHRRSDNDLWSIPGGRIEIGESVAECVTREVEEETGLRVEPVRLSGVYSNPRHVVAYTDGEVRQQFSICVACRIVGGELSADNDESLEVGMFTPDEVAGLSMSEAIRLRIDDALADGTQAVLR